MYNAMVKRQAVEAIEKQKLAMTTALYSNTNWDTEDNDRAGHLKELDKSYNQAIELIYHPERLKKNEADIDWSHPFWQAAQRASKKRLNISDENGDTEIQTLMALEAKRSEAKQRSFASIDQLKKR